MLTPTWEVLNEACYSTLFKRREETRGWTCDRRPSFLDVLMRKKSRNRNYSNCFRPYPQHPAISCSICCASLLVYFTWKWNKFNIIYYGVRFNKSYFYCYSPKRLINPIYFWADWGWMWNWRPLDALCGLGTGQPPYFLVFFFLVSAQRTPSSAE